MQPDLLAKRIRNILFKQKEKLENYLVLLDKEEDDILKKDPDKLILHIELEKNIIEEIGELKKILDPSGKCLQRHALQKR